MDIFDLENLSDIPEDLKNELNITTKSEKKFLSLFNERSTLNHNQILVAWYRKYGKVISRGYVTTSLYRMSKKKLIKPTDKKGEYCYDPNTNNR